MRSPRGFAAAAVLLLAVPVTGLYQMVFANGAAIVIHVALAVGFVLLSFSVFELGTTGWMNWIGCAATSALSAIFFLQAVSELIEMDSLTYLVYRILGQRLETWLVYVFLLWCMAMLLTVSRGKTRILGWMALSIAICLQGYSYALLNFGVSVDAQSQSLKLFYLLLFVWILFESKKARSASIGANRSLVEERPA
jgi:hypothetical protein